MDAVRFHEHGGSDVLRVDDVDRPTPDDDEVLVEVAAAAVNPVDTYFREKSYEPGGLPWITGSDVAGVVTDVGADVEAFEPGDRVFGTGLGNALPGTCAEYVAVPTTHLATLPESVSFAAGAAMALVGVTAWDTLVRACNLEPAETCLVHGGSGGVGHLAVQIADAAGARVTTTASPDYHDRLGELGADTVLDYRRDDLESAIEAAGAPDVILDHRLDDYLGLDSRVAGTDARIAAIGNESLEACFPNVPQCRGKGLSVHHVSMFGIDDYRPVLDRLARLAGAGDLEPVIAREYDLTEVPEAQDAVVSESFLGKLVVRP